MPTFTFTRTIIRIVQNGDVVKIIDTGEIIQKLSPKSFSVDAKALADLVEGFLLAGLDPSSVLRYLPPLPPWIRIDIPRPPRESALLVFWRKNLEQALSRAYSVDYRRNYLRKYLNDIRDVAIGECVIRGFTREQCIKAFNNIYDQVIERANKTSTLEEIYEVESSATLSNIVNSITSSSVVEHRRVSAKQ